MMANLELLQEAARRGILPPDKKPLYDEAVKRGLISGGNPSPPTIAEPETPEWAGRNPNLYGAVGAAKDVGRSIAGAGEGLLTAASNIPQSAANMAGGIYQAVTSPVQTVQGLGEIVTGGAQKLIPGEQKNEGKFDAVVQFFKDRYGSDDALKNTIEQDPVGFMADLSGVLYGAGGITKAATAGKMGAGLTAAGQTVDPINVGAKAVTAPLRAIPKAIPEKLYASSLKMGTKIKPEDRLARVRAGLDRGIMPNMEGLEKLRGQIDAIETDIGSIIKQAAKQGDSVETAKVVKRLDDLYDFADNTIDPASIRSVLDELKNNMAQSHGTKIPVDKAQKIKQNTYVLLRKAYGELKGMNVEGQKQLARGLKEELATLYPELNNLNAQSSVMRRLEQSLEKAIPRIQNRDVIGIGAPLKGLAGHAAHASGGFAAGVLAAAFDFPQVKAALSIAMNRAKMVRPKPVKPYGTAAFQAGRAAGVEENQ